MMRVTIGEISKKSMCRTNRNFEKFENTVNLIYTMCAIYDDAHHHRRNFEKVHVRKNRNFEKFENTVNLIYTMCAMSEMVI